MNLSHTPVSALCQYRANTPEHCPSTCSSAQISGPIGDSCGPELRYLARNGPGIAGTTVHCKSILALDSYRGSCPRSPRSRTVGCARACPENQILSTVSANLPYLSTACRTRTPLTPESRLAEWIFNNAAPLSAKSHALLSFRQFVSRAFPIARACFVNKVPGSASLDIYAN